MFLKSASNDFKSEVGMLKKLDGKIYFPFIQFRRSELKALENENENEHNIIWIKSVHSRGNKKSV